MAGLVQGVDVHDRAVIARPGWVLLKAEAAARGFRNALSFRRWCRRNGVPVRKSGRLETVCPADVDRAVLGGGPAPAPANDDVAHAFALITAGGSLR